MTALDEVVSKPPPGVVLPPKDIRAVAERTAGFVARNGAIFEDRVRSKENHNPKFSFLHANDAYHPFYQWRLSEIKEGRGTDVSAGPIGEAAKKPQEEPKGPEPPPEFEFSARMPIISAQDLEVVRLTALFVAKNGRSFMTALSQRETGNFQFDFLRPQHSLYQFFQRLVEQYKLLLEGNREQERLQQLRHNARDKFHLIDKAKTRAEWVKYQEAQKAQKEEADEAEKLAYAQIDWHDFVVVATIAFDENDEQAELPPPTSLNDLQSASLEQKAMMSLQPHNMRIEEAMPTAEDSYYPQPQHQPVQPPIQQLYPTPSSATPPVPGYGLPPPPIPPPFMAQDDEEELRIRERTEARERTQQAQAAARGQGIMNIKKDYVPRAQAKRQNQQMALCPNCKQQIPYDELEHHMRGMILLCILFRSHLTYLQSNFLTRAGKNKSSVRTLVLRLRTFPQQM